MLSICGNNVEIIGIPSINERFVLACSKRSLVIAGKLLSDGANINHGSGSAIRVAVRNCDIDMVNFLIENGANVSVCDDEPLRNAGEIGRTDMIAALLRAGANAGSLHFLPVINAAKNCHPYAVEMMIAHLMEKFREKHLNHFRHYELEVGSYFSVLPDSVLWAEQSGPCKKLTNDYYALLNKSLNTNNAKIRYFNNTRKNEWQSVTDDHWLIKLTEEDVRKILRGSIGRKN